MDYITSKQEDLHNMNFVIGFFLPALIGTINKNISNSGQRFWVSTVLCVLFGIIVNFIEHNGFPGYLGYSYLDVANSFGESTMFMIGMVKLSYEAVFNNEYIGNFLPNGDKTILEKLDLKNTKK